MKISKINCETIIETLTLRIRQLEKDIEEGHETEEDTYEEDTYEVLSNLHYPILASFPEHKVIEMIDNAISKSKNKNAIESMQDLKLAIIEEGFLEGWNKP
jgi:hypothetical protein